jgi:hypothetical protein
MPLLRRALAAACAAIAVITPFTPLTPQAGAAILSGNDYSWPQCAKGVGDGQGQPLPGGTHTFAVVGLTNGQGLHENPCLASQWAYARAHASLVTGYAIVTYPTAAQRSAASTGHYGHCRTLACRLRNNGWAQGAFTAASLGRIGARPPLVWVDVETRKQQPWSRSRTNNALVVKAVVASLRARGYHVGIYSNRYLWNSIAGYRTSLPEWVPSESLTRGCRLSFAGGRVLLSQWSHTHANGKTYDENGRCAGAPTMSTWWQRSKPLVTSIRNAKTGAIYGRFGFGRAFSLAATARRPATVVSAPSLAGPVPLFVSVTPTHELRARTLGSGWRSLRTRCAGAPTATITGGTLSVACTTPAGIPTITTTTLDAYASPAPVH